MVQKLIAAVFLLALGAAPSHAQLVQGGSGGGGAGTATALFRTAVSVGNGADTTEDTLQSFTMPAGQLAATNDAIHIVAGGVLGGTTDSKSVRIKFAGTVMAAKSFAAAANTFWLFDAWITKTGANAQRTFGGGNAQSVAFAIFDNTSAVTDTGTIAILITGQNNTNSIAGSITCDFLTIDYVRAP